MYGPSSNPGRAKRFFSRTVQTGSGAHPASYPLSTGALSGVKWPGRVVNHSPPSCAKVKNEVSHTPASPIYVHSIERVNFTTFITFM